MPCCARVDNLRNRFVPESWIWGYSIQSASLTGAWRRPSAAPIHTGEQTLGPFSSPAMTSGS